MSGFFNTDPTTWEYQHQRACAAAHVLVHVATVTHAELDACGCAECELVREGMMEAGYLERRPASAKQGDP